LINTFKSQIQSKRNEVNQVISKYEKGLEQLEIASKNIEILKAELDELIPKVK